MTRAEYDVLLRQDFVTFAARCFHDLNPQTELAMNWHLEVIAAKLTAVREGKIRRLIINLPPRHLKSLMASIAFPAWCLGHDPSAQILCVSYAQDLADKLARDCRSIMMSPWYRRIFPTRLAPHRQAVQEFITTRQGYRLATSNGGVLTGRGADIILIDDPLKPEEALSDAQRQAANEWYDHTLYSRLNDKRHGAIVIIMQRLHEDDLVGHVLAQEAWEVVRFPAIAEADEVHQIETIWGPRCFTPPSGRGPAPRARAARNPRPHPPHDRRIQFRRPISAIARATGRRHGQGGMVQALRRERTAGALRPHRAELGHRQQGDRAQRFQRLHDLGRPRQGPLSPRTCCASGSNTRRSSAPCASSKACSMPNVVLIEDKASGTQLIQELIADGCHGVTRYKPECDKIMRLHAQTAMIENGFVHLPEAAPWLAEYLHEMTVFPKGKHDDQVDFDRSVPRLVQNANAALGNIRALRRRPKN